MKRKKTILTGDRPTGPLHLGHYAGSLKNRIKLQDEYRTFILIADIQALTDNFQHPEILKENTMQVMFDYLSVGLDPEKVTFVLQSQVPAIHELAVYYLNMVTLARALRNPTVKSEIQEKRNQADMRPLFGKEFDIPLGFLVYPIHQAADITSFDADLVPVGEDQLPMIEQTREIVRKINGYYGANLLVEPEAMLGDFPRIPGIDGKTKMGKSLRNCIYLKDPEETENNAVMRMYTDSKRVRADIPGTVEGNPVFIYHDAFNPDSEEVAMFKRKYRQGKIGDVKIKKSLCRVINNILQPIRERREYWESRVKVVREMLFDHSSRARRLAGGVLNRVRKAMHLQSLPI